MAGIGFELKKLFARRGLLNKLHAYGVSSTITIGPMLTCMFMIIMAQFIMGQTGSPYMEKELLFSGAVYVFLTSYLIVSGFQMMNTRAVSDMIYSQHYAYLLPSVYRSMLWTVVPGTVIGLLFVLIAPLTWWYKLALYLFFMEMIIIWHLSVYITALKQYQFVFKAFLVGSLTSVAGCLLIGVIGDGLTATGALVCLNIGMALTLAGLGYVVETQFKYKPPAPTVGGEVEEAPTVEELQAAKMMQSVPYWLSKYPRLFGIGFMLAFGMYVHQLLQWIYPDGVTLADTFRMSPMYDISVYYALLTTLPTFVLFVVALETSFYPKCRKYYELVLGQATMKDIEQARKELGQVLTYEISVLMGKQLFFSILCIAIGIRILPLTGFSSSMLETFNILVLAFYCFGLFSSIVLVLLYFDDQKGAFALSLLMVVLSLVFCLVFSTTDNSFPMFLASFVSLAASLSRLRFLVKHLHYYTFSAQPIISEERHW